MALARVDTPSTTIQPAPATQPTDIAAEQAAAGALIQGEKATQELAGQVQQFATTVMREETLKAAQRDAAKAVTIDENGKPVMNENARGIGGLVYNATFTEAATSTFHAQSLADLNRQAELALIDTPSDPVAVKKRLDTYIQGTLANMPEPLAERMRPHFSGVVSGAMGSAAAGKARLDLKGVTEGIPFEENSIMMDRAKTLAYGELTPETEKAIDERIQALNARREKAGEPQETWARKNEWIKKASELHARGIKMGNEVAHADPGTNAIGKANNFIDQLMLSDEYRKWPQARAILETYVQRGAGQQAASENALAYRSAQTVAKLTGSVIQAYQMYDQGHWDSTQRDMALRDIEMQRAAAMVDMRPTQALAVMTAGRAQIDAVQQRDTAVAVEGYRRADEHIVTTYGNTYTNARNMASFGATEAIRQEGQKQIRELDNDGYLDSRSKFDPRAAQIKAGVTQAISDQAIKSQTADLVQSMHQVSSGLVNPEKYPEFIEGLKRNNLLDREGGGGVTTEQLISAMETGRKAFKERATRRGTAAVAQENYIKTGTPLNSSERAARMAELKLTSGDSKIVVDEMGNSIPQPARIDREGVEFAKDFMRREGFYPDGYIKELTGTTAKLTVDPQTQEAALNMVRSYEDHFRKTMAKNYTDARKLEGAVQSYSLDQFGEKTLSAVEAYEKGYAKATPEQIGKAIEEKTGVRQPNASLSSPQALIGAWGITGKLAATLVDATENPGGGKIQGALRAALSLGGLLGNDVVGDFAPFRLEEVRTHLAGKAPSGLTEGNMRWSADTMSDLISFTLNDYIPRRGAIDTQRGLDMYAQAANAWMLSKRDKLSFERGVDADGSTVFTLKTDGFYDAANRANNIQWGQKYWNTFIEKRMEALFPTKAGTVEPGTYQITSERMDNGRMIYTVSGLHKNTKMPVQFTDVRPDDPLWKTELDRVGVAVARQMDQREANSIVDKYWSLNFFREAEFKKARDKFIEDSSAKKDPGETWVAFAQTLRKMIGPDSSISEEALDAFGRPEIGRVLREQGLIDFVVNGPGDITVGLGDNRGNLGQKVQAGVKPAPDPGLVDPAQYTSLEQKARADEMRRQEAARQGAPLPPQAGGGASATPGTIPPGSVTGGIPFDPNAPSADPRPPQNRTPVPPEPKPATVFKPEGDGYDIARAKAEGMKPKEDQPNKGHMGPVAPTTQEERRKYGLPRESYILLKGKTHETWHLAVEGEEERGFEVRKFGDRYYSVPKAWKPDKGQR